MFQRTLFHIHEYGEQGLQCLPAVVCVNDATVLWTPCPLVFDQSVSDGGGIISSADLLELIEKKHVRVIGRETWFDRRWRNNAAWPSAKWKDAFDDEIMRIANEESSRPLVDRRVIVANRESGFGQAAAKLARNRRLRSSIRNLYLNKTLPLGTYEKARSAQEKHEDVEIQILRDVYNHQNAIEEAGAGDATITDTFMQTLITVAQLRGGQSPPPAAENLSKHKVREAIEILTKLTPVMSSRNLKQFLSSGLRSDLRALLLSDRAVGTLPTYVMDQIAKSTAAKSFFKRLLPSEDPITWVLTFGTLIAMCSSLQLGVIPFAIAPFTYCAAKGWLQSKSLIRLDLDSNRCIRTLFQLIYGRAWITREEVSKILKCLELAT